MRTDLILALASHLDEVEVNNPRSFNMLTWGERRHACGTAACLAGHTLAIYDSEKFEKILNKKALFDPSVEAAAILELDHGTASELFLPDVMLERKPVTAAEAAETLRTLARTGVVVWRGGRS